MNNVAAYIRVSSAQQTTENQLPAIIDYCHSRGWPDPVIYSENESAWHAGHQKELARLKADLTGGRHKFDYLIIWSLDRLCREGISTMLQKIHDFERLGCRIVSCQESWLSDNNDTRELFISLAAWNANFESKRRSARVRAGMARKAKENGGKMPVRGKDKNKRKRTGYLLRYVCKRKEPSDPVKVCCQT